MIYYICVNEKRLTWLVVKTTSIMKGEFIMKNPFKKENTQASQQEKATPTLDKIQQGSDKVASLTGAASALATTVTLGAIALKTLIKKF